MTQDQIEKGYVQKTITFLLPTQIGDQWLNSDKFEFDETKKGWVIVKEKELSNNL